MPYFSYTIHTTSSQPTSNRVNIHQEFKCENLQSGTSDAIGPDQLRFRIVRAAEDRSFKF